MKRIKLAPVFLALSLLAACAPSQPVLQTAIAQTQAVWTPVPTQTPYATYTLQPTVVITQIVTATFTPTPEFTPTPTVAPSIITVDGGTGHITRTPTIAAFYMLIHNTGEGDDHLIGASSEACGRMALQQMGYPGRNNLSIYVGIPAKSVVELKMGGFSYRLLCYDIKGIGLGSSVPLALTFEKFGEVKITIEIGNPPP
jgi:copper(I)-binding protein